MSKLLLATVAAIGLLLAGPQKASAQVIYACGSSIGSIVIVAANAACPPSAGGPTWTKISWTSVARCPFSILAVVFLPPPSVFPEFIKLVLPTLAFANNAIQALANLFSELQLIEYAIHVITTEPA